MFRFGHLGLVVALLLIGSACCTVADDLATIQPAGSGVTTTKNTFLCKVCGVFWEVVEDVLGDQKVDEWLIEYVEEKLCPMLPTQEAQEECVEKAPTFVPTIIHWAEGLANGAMCTDAGVCGDDVLYTTTVGVDLQEDDNCQICKKLAAFVKDEVDKLQPDTVVQRINELKEECDRLDGEEAEKCKAIVDKYGYLLLAFIEKEKDTDIEKACSDIGVCPRLFSGPVVDPLPVELVSKMAEYAATASNDESACDRCKAITTAAHNDIVNQDTQEAVIAYLSRACAWVPVYTEQCNEAVGNYTIQALDTIAMHLNPDEVCNYLGICNEQSLARGETAAIEGNKFVEPIYVQ